MWYEKRVAQKKNKMSTINVITNSFKRMFEIFKSNKPYVISMIYTT